MILSVTQKNILKVAEQEFMSYGFQKSSLRNIAKTAGMTTGAVYGYYSDKESLFAALVSDPANELIAKFDEMLSSYAMLEGNKKIRKAEDYIINGIVFFCDYIYEHRNAFYLITQCSKGTQYSSYVDDLALIEEKAVQKYFDYLISKGKINDKIDDMLIHILVGSSFRGVFEVVVHDMTKEKAIQYAKNLAEFYVAGWNKILGH